MACHLKLRDAISYLNCLWDRGPHAQDFQRYTQQKFVLEPEWSSQDRNAVLKGVMEALYQAPPSKAEDI